MNRIWDLPLPLTITQLSILDWIRVRDNYSKRPSLDGSKIEIKKVPVCKSAIISQIPNTVSTDYLQLVIEKYCGDDSVEEINYEKGQTFASVRFHNPRGVSNIFYYNSTALMLNKIL